MGVVLVLTRLWPLEGRGGGNLWEGHEPPPPLLSTGAAICRHVGLLGGGPDDFGEEGVRLLHCHPGADARKDPNYVAECLIEGSREEVAQLSPPS